MISKILILTGLIAAVHGTFRCGPFETPSIFKCDDNCLGTIKKCVVGLGCSCILGYKRNENGKCVPKRECCTAENEQYCESGPDRTCADIFARTFISHWPHKGRCCCKEGTVRDPNGKCVAEIECYPKCTGANEEHDDVGCDSICNLKGVKEDECIIKPDRCHCKEGYARQNEGDADCKPRSECKCDDPNECYEINGGCEKDCNGSDCVKCPGRPGCYCMGGFVRKTISGDYSKCVLPKQCKRIIYGEGADTENVE